MLQVSTINKSFPLAGERISIAGLLGDNQLVAVIDTPDLIILEKGICHDLKIRNQFPTIGGINPNRNIGHGL